MKPGILRSRPSPVLKHPSFPRVNYVRDCFVWGNSYYPFDWMRLYGEVGWAFYNSGGSQPWEFQYGTELIQARRQRFFRSLRAGRARAAAEPSSTPGDGGGPPS